MTVVNLPRGVDITGGSSSIGIYYDRGNPAVNPSVAYNSGVVGGTTQRMVLATDVAGSVRLIANSGVDIGDVDVLSIAAGDSNIGNVDIVSGTLTNITNTVGVYFDRANPAVSANYGSGTFLVAFDRANPSVSIGGASSSIGVYFDRGNPGVNLVSGTLTSITNTVAVYFDRANPAISANYGSGTFIVGFDSSKGFLQGINTSIGIYFDRAVPSVKKDVASSGSYGAVQLLPMQRQVLAANTSRKSAVFVHDSANTVYIGLNSLLTTGSLGTGFPIVSNQAISFDDYTGAFFGALDAGDVKIKYIEI